MKHLSLKLLAETILSRKKVLKMSQVILAEKTGINRSLLSRLESGNYTPSVDQLLALSSVLGFDNSDIFEDDTYVILRLNEFVSDGTPINYSPTLLTIEHVLPQTVDPKSEWATVWSDPSKREMWIHKIANLVPLTRPKNSEAQNFDFDKKKNVYFTGKKGTTAYPLTTQVVHEKIWDEQTVIKRQQALIKVFTDAWELRYDFHGSVEMTDDGAIIYHVTLRGSNATGYEKADHFTVIKGSRIAADTVPSFLQYYPNAYNLRNQLISSGIIVNYQFTSDYDFESLSLAASVVIGRTANGYTVWKDGSGLSFGENQKNKGGRR